MFGYEIQKATARRAKRLIKKPCGVRNDGTIHDDTWRYMTEIVVCSHSNHNAVFSWLGRFLLLLLLLLLFVVVVVLLVFVLFVFFSFQTRRRSGTGLPFPNLFISLQCGVVWQSRRQHLNHCTTWSEDCRRQTSVDKNLLKNYRPISNLPFLSKILEKVVLHKPLSHLQDNNLSNPFQSAYRAGHSTETVLLRVVNGIFSALDDDNISVLLLLDPSVAFFTMDHQILLSRLNSVSGIQSTALQWFQSYLSEISPLQ